MKRLHAKYAAEEFMEGFVEGFVEGLSEGKAEALHTCILIFVKARFPALRKQTRQNISQITNADELQDVFEQLVSAADEVAVREILATLEPEA